MPRVEWDAERAALLIDGEQFDADEGSGPVLVRVGLLSRLRTEELPEGVEVWPARRVIGSRGRDFYRDPDGFTLRKEEGRVVIFVEDAIIRDAEEFPDEAQRTLLIQQDRAAALERLQALEESGAIESPSVSDLYDSEIVHVSYTLRLPLQPHLSFF
jgi:hypothetical protein